MVCIKCGGYAWAGLDSLCKVCPGKAPTSARGQQRRRALQGLFPSWAKQYKGWTVTCPRVPAPMDLLLLLRAARKGIVVSKDEDVCPKFFEGPTWGERWETSVLLSRYGLPPPDGGLD